MADRSQGLPIKGVAHVVLRFDDLIIKHRFYVADLPTCQAFWAVTFLACTSPDHLPHHDAAAERQSDIRLPCES